MATATEGAVTDGAGTDGATIGDPATPGAEPALDARTQSKADAAALADLLAPVRGSIRAGMAFEVLACVCAVVPFAAVLDLGHTVLADPHDSAGVWRGLAWLFAGLIGRAVFSNVALMITHLADARLQNINQRRIVDTLARVPLAWFTRTSSGRVRKALDNDVTTMHYLVAHQNVETLGAALTPLFGLVFAFWIDWRLGLLTVCTIPIYLVAYTLMCRGQGEKMLLMDRKLGLVGSRIVELVAGVAVLKTFGRADRAHDAYQEAATEFGDFYHGWVRPFLRADSLTTMALATPVVMAVNLAGGRWVMTTGAVDAMDVVTTTLISAILPGAITVVANGMFARSQAAAAAYRIATLIATPPLPTPADATTAPELPPGPVGVDIEHVTFAYEAGHPVLRDVSVHVAPGTVTALVGPSGSGKSTLAMLVPRFGDPDSGVVRVGGIDVRDLPAPTLYRTVGFVLQNVQLLGISLADNIRLARPDASLPEVEAAARAARVHDVITALPRGYDAVVGQDAVLSGGERQRVSIARAILADPPVLVLDEASSFADPESEAAVQEALGALLADRTLIVIAHRLESVAQADQIVVLERGAVAQVGTHAQLLAAGGAYTRLWHANRPADPADPAEPTPSTDGAPA